MWLKCGKTSLDYFSDEWPEGFILAHRTTRGWFSQFTTQALLLSGHHAGLYNYIYTKVGKLSLLL